LFLHLSYNLFGIRRRKKKVLRSTAVFEVSQASHTHTHTQFPCCPLESAILFLSVEVSCLYTQALGDVSFWNPQCEVSNQTTRSDKPRERGRKEHASHLD